MIIRMDMSTGRKIVEMREEYGEEVLLSNWLPQPEVGLALQQAVSHRDFLRSQAGAHTWTPPFAKLSIVDGRQVKIAAIHPDF